MARMDAAPPSFSDYCTIADTISSGRVVCGPLRCRRGGRRGLSPMARNHRIRKFCAGLWMHRKPFFRIAPGRREASFRDRAPRAAKARGLFRIRCLFAITGGSPCSHAARTSGPGARGMFHVKHPYEKTERPDGRHPGARMFHVKRSQLPTPPAVNARGARPRPHLRLRARRRGCSTRA